MSAKYRAAFRKTLCGIQAATANKTTVGGGPPQVGADRLLPRYGSQISNGGRGGPRQKKQEESIAQQHNVMVCKIDSTLCCEQLSKSFCIESVLFRTF